MHKKRVIFLDRDGTINVDSGYVHKIAGWEFTNGAIEALEQLQAAGFLLAVVTNQSGIGHKLYAERDVKILHNYMKEELEQSEVKFTAIVYCPHKRDGGCGCRKPETGMIKQIENKIGPIDFKKSWVIGDKIADLEMGKNAGTKTALIRSRYWQESDVKQQPDMIVDSLREAAKRIVI